MFSLKTSMVEKKSLFFYKVFFILANETKDDNCAYKKTLSYDFLIFCMQIFFFVIFLLAKKQVCSQKGLKIFYLKFLFLFMKKNAYHTIFIYENCMIGVFYKKKF